MSGFPNSMKKLIEEFGRLPGIGPRSAQRLAFYILKSPKDVSVTLSKAIAHVKETVRFCARCNNLSDDDICNICSDPSRDKSVICVVEEPNDINTIEKMKSFKGLYHVLLGSLSPLDGIGPEDLKIKELIERVNKGKTKELIIATDFNTEGEATALYLSKVLKPCGVKLTRVAYGIPVGSSLEYADSATLVKAFDGRKQL